MTYGYSAEELLTQCAATCRKKKEKICGSLRSYQRERNEELMLLEYESSPLFYGLFSPLHRSVPQYECVPHSFIPEQFAGESGQQIWFFVYIFIRIRFFP